jgi:hypothetical protein
MSTRPPLPFATYRRSGSRQIEHALRLAEPGQAPLALLAIQVEHLHGVVSERGDEQAVALQVDREMVDAPFDAGHRNRAYGLEHLGCAACRGKRHGEREGDDQPWR